MRRGCKTFIGIAQRRSSAKIAAIRGKYAGAPVTASEPVFGYMARRSA